MRVIVTGGGTGGHIYPAIAIADKFKEMDPITAVSVIHHGKYDTLRDAYLFAVNWARENGCELMGEPRERYIHGAWDRQEESEWVTELQLPIRGM